ncbi:switch-associated protein 70-like [Mytilus californianus]|uniref:switch-associated protein 70-like n=1 Tax=Mytilus californianus TaxID=6549 RepID=UPI002247D290|nr:switch-associated protein 70-like [Mytilus californianus]
MPGFSIRDPHRHGGAKVSRGRWSSSVELLKIEAMKSIWYAFQTLIDPQNEMVQIHTLKVLTASIGNALGIEKSEELHDKTDQTELDFKSYFVILESLMFEPLSRVSDETMDLSSIDYQHVHQVCWVLFYNNQKGKTIPDDVPENIAFKLWLMYNLFSEEDDSNKPIFPLKLDPEEASTIFEGILTQTGNHNLLCSATEDFGDEPMTYQKYLATFFVHIFKHVKEGILKSSVDTVHEQFVIDILKKGNLLKRGHQVKNWKERYMVLNPTELKYYASSHQKHMKGTVVFNKSQTVEILPDKGGKHNLFVLNTQQKPYEMSALDLKTRNEWVSCIQIALDNCENPHYHHHKELSKQRRQKRNIIKMEKENEERKRQEEEDLHRQTEEGYKQREQMNEEMLRQRNLELEEEKRRREQLEAQLREQEALREAERQRLLELEASKSELEKLLELERQAKKDEETVRRLQAKLLDEESEKRQELEKLKREQEEILKHEREMREGLEDQKEEKDQILLEAQAKLSELENERVEASEKLEKATERLQEAENERLKMEEKVKLWKKPNVGLARPIQPTNRPLITHRGLGAFCATDFLRKSRQQDKQRGMTKKQLDEKYGEHVLDMSDEEENGKHENKSPVSKTFNEEINTQNLDNVIENSDVKISTTEEGLSHLVNQPQIIIQTVTDQDQQAPDKISDKSNEKEENKEEIKKDEQSKDLEEEDQCTQSIDCKEGELDIETEKSSISKEMTLEKDENKAENINEDDVQKLRFLVDNSLLSENHQNKDSEHIQAMTRGHLGEENQTYVQGDGTLKDDESADLFESAKDISSTNSEEKVENHSLSDDQKGESFEQKETDCEVQVRGSYENVTFNSQSIKSDEKTEGESECSNTKNENDRNETEDSSIKNNNDEESYYDQPEDETNDKDMSAFSNLTYQNINMNANDQKSDERNKEDEDPNVYDYVELKNEHFEQK